MICPYCNANDDKVIDSRESDGAKVVRRRRECVSCGKRFTTYERAEQTTRLMVIKRDGTRVPFNRDNVLRGVMAAFGKRAVPEDIKDRLVDSIEDELHREFDREVRSIVIGERVMNRLKEIDEVAYIRFASEYLKFQSLDDLKLEMDQLQKRVKDVKNQQKLF